MPWHNPACIPPAPRPPSPAVASRCPLRAKSVGMTFLDDE
ncbi:hypothetical protein BLL52_2452 [Rhodoferax antarcticus ANT.BR]|uniref:Uncharacterized protein n=1 Tax=Rhodoferax antarcticus ANT.BR TaxID=1111071 RepID=A0A1Q8YDT4_9BURK|nr:hypothetical protein BLL52_2452 [Rhodoferax antarcticus ANT.BR]